MAAFEMNRVLVVGPDPRFEERLERILEPEFDLRSLSSIESPLDALADQVDIALFHSNRPGTSERQLLDRFRSAGNTHPVGLLADRSPSFDVHSAGFVACLVRPFDAGNLRDLVHSLALHARYVALLETNFLLATEIAGYQSEPATNGGEQGTAYRAAMAALIAAKAEVDEVRQAAVDAGVLERAFYSLAQ